MQIVAKTGFDISIVKSCLLGQNVKKIFQNVVCWKKKRKEKENNTKTATH